MNKKVKTRMSRWGGRKLVMFVITSLYYSLGSTALLIWHIISEANWSQINVMIITVAFSAFVLGNVGEHFANHK